MLRSINPQKISSSRKGCQKTEQKENQLIFCIDSLTTPLPSPCKMKNHLMAMKLILYDIKVKPLNFSVWIIQLRLCFRVFKKNHPSLWHGIFLSGCFLGGSWVFSGYWANFELKFLPQTPSEGVLKKWKFWKLVIEPKLLNMIYRTHKKRNKSKIWALYLNFFKSR